MCEGAVWWAACQAASSWPRPHQHPVSQARVCVCRGRVCVCVCVCGVGGEAVREGDEERLGDIWRERWRKEAHIKLPSKTIAPS